MQPRQTTGEVPHRVTSVPTATSSPSHAGPPSSFLPGSDRCVKAPVSDVNERSGERREGCSEEVQGSQQGGRGRDGRV
ncbi:hypothetical protein GN956_G16896 [Arapaima gigas]